MQILPDVVSILDLEGQREACAVASFDRRSVRIGDAQMGRSGQLKLYKPIRAKGNGQL